jgi:hypothetical protein
MIKTIQDAIKNLNFKLDLAYRKRAFGITDRKYYEKLKKDIADLGTKDSIIRLTAEASKTIESYYNRFTKLVTENRLDLNKIGRAHV